MRLLLELLWLRRGKFLYCCYKLFCKGWSPRLGVVGCLLGFGFFGGVKTFVSLIFLNEIIVEINGIIF